MPPMTPKHNYDYEVDLSSDSAAAHVIRMVGHQKKVLEVGAGPGSITKHLKNTNQCTVTAIEYDESALPYLEKYCSRVHRLDLNQPGWISALQDQAPFDVVIAADVLEHLYSPLSTLGQMRVLTNPDGYIVVSLPHISHAGVFATMLNENFNYGDWGLLDKTHIRFFGLANIQALFEKAELKIVAAQFVIRPPELTEFADCWAKTPKYIKEFLLRHPEGNIYQVVVKAKHRDSPGEMLDLFHSTPLQLRHTNPFQHLYYLIKNYFPKPLRSKIRNLLKNWQ